MEKTTGKTFLSILVQFLMFILCFLGKCQRALWDLNMNVDLTQMPAGEIQIIGKLLHKAFSQRTCWHVLVPKAQALLIALMRALSHLHEPVYSMKETKKTKQVNKIQPGLIIIPQRHINWYFEKLSSMNRVSLSSPKLALQSWWRITKLGSWSFHCFQGSFVNWLIGPTLCQKKIKYVSSGDTAESQVE